jgi:hypothetical protein
MAILLTPKMMAQSSRLNPVPGLFPKTTANPAPKVSSPPIKQLMKELPLIFESNLGQTDPQVRFLTGAGGITSFLTDHANVLVLSRRKDTPDASDPDKIPEIEQTVVRMKLDGAKAPRSFEGLDQLESISNYFIGNVPSKWLTKVPSYGKVRASSVYQGIGLVFYGDSCKLDYDFVVRPGTNPGSIHLAYEGAASLTTDREGSLLIATQLGKLVQRKPLDYQEFDGERREVQASYSIRSGKVQFALSNWDRRRDLVIDPVLEYSTYLGCSGADRAYSIAVDSTGVAYVTSSTSSTNFPNTTGAHQTGESKIEIPVADGKISAGTIPPSAQLDARNSRENLCNVF